MEQTYIVVIGLAILFAVLYYLRKRGSGRTPGSSSGALRREARRRLRMPPDQADQIIERHMERLRERYPGRSEEWYLDKIIYDLERDR